MIKSFSDPTAAKRWADVRSVLCIPLLAGGLMSSREQASGQTMDQILKDKLRCKRAAQVKRIRVRRERHGAAHPFFWASIRVSGR